MLSGEELSDVIVVSEEESTPPETRNTSVPFQERNWHGAARSPPLTECRDSATNTAYFSMNSIDVSKANEVAVKESLESGAVQALVDPSQDVLESLFSDTLKPVSSLQLEKKDIDPYSSPSVIHPFSSSPMLGDKKTKEKMKEEEKHKKKHESLQKPLKKWSSEASAVTQTSSGSDTCVKFHKIPSFRQSPRPTSGTAAPSPLASPAPTAPATTASPRPIAASHTQQAQRDAQRSLSQTSPRTERLRVSIREEAEAVLAEVSRPHLPPTFGRVPEYLASDRQRRVQRSVEEREKRLQQLSGERWAGLRLLFAVAATAPGGPNEGMAGLVETLVQAAAAREEERIKRERARRAVRRCLKLYREGMNNAATRKERREVEQQRALAQRLAACTFYPAVGASRNEASGDSEKNVPRLKPAGVRAFVARSNAWRRECRERLERKVALQREEEEKFVRSLQQRQRLRRRSRWRQVVTVVPAAGTTIGFSPVMTRCQRVRLQDARRDEAVGASAVPLTNRVVAQRMRALRLLLKEGSPSASEWETSGQRARRRPSTRVWTRELWSRIQNGLRERSEERKAKLQRRAEVSLHDEISGAPFFSPNAAPMLWDDEEGTYLSIDRLNPRQLEQLKRKLQEHHLSYLLSRKRRKQKVKREWDRKRLLEPRATPKAVQSSIEAELSKCTFRPAISPYSRALSLKEAEGDAKPMPVYERLFQWKPEEIDRSEPSPEQDMKRKKTVCTPQRLQLMLERDAHWKESRLKKLERLRQELEESERRECTFTPQRSSSMASQWMRVYGRRIDVSESATRRLSSYYNDRHPRDERLAAASEARLLSDIMGMRFALNHRAAITTAQLRAGRPRPLRIQAAPRAGTPPASHTAAAVKYHQSDPPLSAPGTPSTLTTTSQRPVDVSGATTMSGGSSLFSSSAGLSPAPRRLLSSSKGAGPRPSEVVHVPRSEVVRPLQAPPPVGLIANPWASFEQRTRLMELKSRSRDEVSIPMETNAQHEDEEEKGIVNRVGE